MMKPKNVLCLLVALLCLLLPTIGNGEGRSCQSLDGAWQIVFDQANEGGAKQWVREKQFPQEQMRVIAVPSCWELIEKGHGGIAYYRHAFKVPANWVGKTIQLHFAAVNFRSEVWLNDTEVGKAAASPSNSVCLKTSARTPLRANT